MPGYDGSAFAPPAPVAEVEFLHPDSGARSPVTLMLFDSGADVTVVLKHVVRSLDISLQDAACYDLAAYDGAVQSVPAVLLKLRFSGRIFHGRFVVVAQLIGVLGRNVLNSVVVILDGPQLEWSEVSR